MFRVLEVFHSATTGFPRIRGDVPARGGWVFPGAQFSPHTRGCSGVLSIGTGLDGVFPAYAGMFLFLLSSLSANTGFPRIRGDVPLMGGLVDTIVRFSPHTRGCSSGVPTVMR